MATLPIVALTLLVIWISSVFISKPLWQLASVVKNFESHTSTKRDLNEVKPWYFEASHLNRSFLSTFNIVSNTIDQLHLDTLTDSMTGLLNRRGLDKAIDNLRIQNIPFS
ncbi:diguanylate cyclase, partial [Vibrio xuii]